MSDPDGTKSSEDWFDSPSSPGKAHRELSLESLFAAIGATGQQPADPDAHRYIFAAATMALREQESGRALTDADIRYYRGIALAVQKKLEPAAAEFAAALRLRPHFAEAHNELGNVLRDQGKREEAIAEFRAAIRIKPDFACPHYNLGFILAAEGRTAAAIAEFRSAIRINPDDATAHNELGIALQDHGEVEEAIAEFRAAIRLNPDFAAAHTNLAVALHVQGKVDEAMPEFRAAIRLEPDSAMFHCNLAVALLDHGKVDDAIAECRAAIRLQPDYAKAHNQLSIALEEQAKRNEATKMRSPASAFAAIGATLLRCLGMGRRRGRQPADADAHYNRGITLAEEWELDEAIAEFRAAIRLQPELVGAHIGLANALNALKDKDEAENAIAEFREAIRLQPDNVDAHHGLADTLGRQGQREEAIAEYRIVIRLQPGSLDGMRTGTPEWDEAAAAASAHYRLAVAHRGVVGGAAIIIAECREAIRLQPDFAPAHSFLGKALEGQGEVQQAIAEYRAAVRLRPDDYTSRHILGRALLGQGMADEAIAEYREQIRLQPDFAPAYSWLSAALESKGEFTEALSELRKVRDSMAKAGETQRDRAALDAIGFTQMIERSIAEFEPLAEREKKLQSVLSGQARPASTAEALAFARLCSKKQLHGASARFWAAAFRSDRTLADEAGAHHRYHAACAAALGGTGQGKADPALDLAAQAGLRRRALDWLKAELAAWDASVGSNDTLAPLEAARTLTSWKAHSDLAGVRDPDALVRLPEAERKDWQALWADVEAVLMRASRAASRLDPDDALAHFDLGDVEALLMRASRAGIRVDPDNAEAHVYLGNALRAQGNLNEAIGAYLTAIRLQPGAAEAHTNLGFALADQGKLEEAITAFRAAVQLHPGSAEARTNLANALARQGKPEEAIAEFRAAIRCKPNAAKAHYNLGTALREQGWLAEAVDEYRTAIRLDPDNAVGYYNLGRALRAKGELAEAIAAFREARDHTQPGSDLALLIERALAESDH